MEQIIAIVTTHSIFLLVLTLEATLKCWNFNQDRSSPTYNPPLRWSFFVKISNHFRKRLHLRCLTAFWRHLCCVCDNYFSIHFPTSALFVTFSCLWGFKALSFSTFIIFHETHASVLQLATKSFWEYRWHLSVCS